MDLDLALKSRVKEVMNACKISANELQRVYGISHSTISSQVNGKSKISGATLAALLDYNKSISAEWLLRGEGEMFFNKQTS